MKQLSQQDSCTVALLSKRNHATEPMKNATNDATTNATNDLISLSMRVLARNERNFLRNNDATNELRSSATNATQGSNLWWKPSIDLFGLTLSELQSEANEDWNDVKDNPSMLLAFAQAIHDQKLMKKGEIPVRFTATTFCKSCKKQVPIPPELVNDGEVIGCMWCWVRN